MHVADSLLIHSQQQHSDLRETQLLLWRLKSSKYQNSFILGDWTK